MTKGGNKPRLAGARFELEVKREQERIGRSAWKLRQGGGEVVDVIAVERCGNGRCTVHAHVSHVWLIQCKVSGPYLPPVERERLQERAEAIGATPLVAWKDKGIQYKDIS